MFYNSHHMYAEVVVLTYQAPDIGTFTYEIPKNLEGQIKIGQVVQVPFGNRNPIGIVLSTDYGLRTTDNRIKPITSIVFEQPILLPYQIELLKWMASYYFAPMVNCLEAMLPRLPTKLSKYSSSGAGRNREVSNGSKFSTSSNNMQKAVDQTLVLIPSINRLPETLAQFPQAKNYALYHNQLKTSGKFANWLKISEGNVDYIFGSRSAIFAPCPNLSKITIFDEHDGAYKDERSPYFDTLTVAEKLAGLTGAKLEIIDSSPQVTTYFNHQKELTIPKRQGGPQVEIVSMSEERHSGNKSPISSALSDELEKIRKIKGRALLFLNKKAESGQLYCRACKQQNFAPKTPAMCPNCQSPDIFFHSLNIISLAQEVKKVVPLSTCNIATSAIFYAQVFQKYDLVAHISTDSILNIADIATSEKLYSQITDLKKLTKENGVLILQTYNPESELLKNAARGDFKNFYLNELKMRKMLLYPPYSLLVKLTIKGKSKDLIFKKAKNLFSALQSILTENIIILGPYEPVFLGKTPRYNIILKVKLDSYGIKSKEKAVRQLLPYISKVPKGWQITVEPDNLN